MGCRVADRPKEGERARGYRKVQLKPGDPTSLDPRYIVAVRDARALPGETGALEYEPGRGPVTDEEALGVMRRRKGAQLARMYAESTPDALAQRGLPLTLEEALERHLPTELPPRDKAKEVTSISLPPRLMARLVARAEVEGRNLNALIEMLLWRLDREPPQDPEQVRREYAEMMGDLMTEKVARKVQGR